MAFFRFLVLCVAIIYISCSAAEDGSIAKVPDVKPVSRIAELQKQCLESKVINARNSKILCLLCTGFDRSCFDSPTDGIDTNEKPIAAPDTEKNTKTEAPAVE